MTMHLNVALAVSALVTPLGIDLDRRSQGTAGFSPTRCSQPQRSARAWRAGPGTCTAEIGCTASTRDSRGASWFSSPLSRETVLKQFLPRRTNGTTARPCCGRVDATCSPFDVCFLARLKSTGHPARDVAIGLGVPANFPRWSTLDAMSFRYSPTVDGDTFPGCAPLDCRPDSSSPLVGEVPTISAVSNARVRMARGPGSQLRWARQHLTDGAIATHEIAIVPRRLSPAAEGRPHLGPRGRGQPVPIHFAHRNRAALTTPGWPSCAAALAEIGAPLALNAHAPAFVSLGSFARQTSAVFERCRAIGGEPCLRTPHCLMVRVGSGRLGRAQHLRVLPSDGVDLPITTQSDRRGCSATISQRMRPTDPLHAERHLLRRTGTGLDTWR